MKSEIDLFVINKIKEKRKELKVSQRGMAEILDCSAGFIGQVESENSDTKYSVHQLYHSLLKILIAHLLIFSLRSTLKLNSLQERQGTTGSANKL